MVRLRVILLMVFGLCLTGLFRDCSAASSPLRGSPLVVESDRGLEGLAEPLSRIDTSRFRTALQLTGLDDVDPPVRVLLASDGSKAARRAPSWAAGYATGGIVVLIPSRVKAYPDRSLDMLLDHEVAHVLIARALRGRHVPRWFNEGLALAAARDQSFEDRTRVWLGVLVGGRVPMADLDRFFREGPSSASLAYAISGAFVRDLLDRRGPEVTARILALVSEEVAFDEAFHQATGVTLERWEASFWRRRLLWDRWVPVLTSSVTLWTGISLLALYAIRRRRQRDAAIRSRWEQEELGLSRLDDDYESDETVH